MGKASIMLTVDVALKSLSKDDVQFLDDLLVAGKGTTVAATRGWNRYQLARQVGRIRRAFGNERLWRVADAYRLSKIPRTHPEPNLSNIQPPKLDEVMQRFMNAQPDYTPTAKPAAAPGLPPYEASEPAPSRTDLMEIASGMAQHAAILTCLSAVSFGVALGVEMLNSISNGTQQAVTTGKPLEVAAR